MSENITFVVENMCHSDAPDEYKKEALYWTRKKAGNELYKILYGNRLPAVVDIEESIERDYRNQYMGVSNDRIRIEVTMNPVQWKNVTLPYIEQSSLLFNPDNKRKSIWLSIKGYLAKIWSLKWKNN